ncbi:MAG: rhomboid family intramembrane serine protease [Anaerolineaceae bacterium]|nr:MAG: rhomboid family intramembrane serine protease [Anaerolineaceae bacterium]
MRIEDGIIRQLTTQEYQQLDIKIDAMDMFYRSDYMGTEIVLILRAITGNEISPEEYKLIIKNIKDRFLEGGFSDIHLLGLILTAVPERARRLYLDDDDHFIVDLRDRRLIVYENQSAYFAKLVPIIENIIHDEYYSSGLDQKGYRRSHNTHNHKIHWVTLLNTIFIVANIILYILVHHTVIFGESVYALQKGALSWYIIKEEGEYYRLLTSMFLHSDFEHLMNNMLVLFFVGDNLERAAGKIKYLIIYFGSGIIAGISSISYNMIKERLVLSVGASGAIFGIVGAMGYILLVNKGHLEDISSRQIILFTVFSLYGGIANANIDNVAHIGGFIGGIILAFILYRRPKRAKENEA